VFFDFGVFSMKKEEKRSVLLQILLQENHIFRVPCCPKFHMRELFKEAPPKR
jgi:hypothetical protein